LFYLLLFWEFF